MSKNKYPPYFSLPKDAVVVLEPMMVPDMRDKDADKLTIKGKQGKEFQKWKMRVDVQGAKPDQEWGTTRDWMMWEEQYDLWQKVSGGSYATLKGNQFRVWDDEGLVIENADGQVFRQGEVGPEPEPATPSPSQGEAPKAQRGGSLDFDAALAMRRAAYHHEARCLRELGVEPTADALVSAVNSLSIAWERGGKPAVATPVDRVEPEPADDYQPVPDPEEVEDDIPF